MTLPSSGQMVFRCPYCSSPVPIQASVCTGCGAVRSNWVQAGFPVVPLTFLGLLAAYGILGPYLLYHFSFAARGPLSERGSGIAFALAVTVIGIFVIRWFVLVATKERWFRRH